MKHIYLFLLLAILLASCSTGMKALNKGNYYDATIKAVEFLRTKPDSEKALSTIAKSYPLALDYYQQKIEEYSRSNNANKYLNIANTYLLMNNMADEITRCPSALNAVKPVVYYHDQLAKAETLAADEQYKLGQTYLRTGTLVDARNALTCFQTVKEMNPNYPNIDEMVESATYAATLKIVVEAIPVYSQSVGLSATTFFEQTYFELQKRAGKEFVQFFTPEEAEDAGIVPNQIVRMLFTDFVVGNVYDKETQKQYSADSIVIATQNGKAIYGTVKATAYQYTREVVTKGTLTVKIIDYVSNKALSSKNFSSQYTWQSTWAKYNGDERALPTEIKQMAERKQVSAPTAQELFLLFSQPLFENSTSFVTSYYRNY